MASDKAIFVRVVRLMNFISAGAMVVNAVSRFFAFETSTDTFFYLLTVYLCAFAALLILAEIRHKKLLIYCEFLKSRVGKGLFVVMVGLLTFDQDRKFDMITGIGLTLVGIFNIVVACMRDTISSEGSKEQTPLFYPNGE